MHTYILANQDNMFVIFDIGANFNLHLSFETSCL